MSHQSNEWELSAICWEVLGSHNHRVFAGIQGPAGPWVGGGSPAVTLRLPEPQPHQGPPAPDLPPPTYLSRQCAAVRTHWWWMTEPLQMYMPMNRMLTCHGHLPASTSFPFTILQDRLV